MTAADGAWQCGRQTLLAVVIVVKAKAVEPPPWHLCCRHCGEFALVKTGNLARGPPTCAPRKRAG